MRRVLDAVLVSVLAASPATAARLVIPLEADWRFLRGEAIGAEQRGFDDGAWRTVTVPHDWSIEGPYDERAPSGRGGGYLPSGVSWYRQRFVLPPEQRGRQVRLELDGVMAGGRVWVNGHHLGHRPNGYVSHHYDLTSYLRYGETDANVIAVRTDTALQPASRWYTGQGLHRRVRLVSTDVVHVVPWGVYVTTPEVASPSATVRVQVEVANISPRARRVEVRTALLDPAGRPAGAAEAEPTMLPSDGRTTVTQDLRVAAPLRWDLATPHLYRVEVQVLADGTLVDGASAVFGIREARFEAATGFWLNGRNLKIKGVCLHHDGGAVGAAVPNRVWERRLRALQRLGVNAVRTAHNPPSPEFLDLCDRLGVLVMDEVWDAWTVGKNHANYGIHLHFPEWWEADTRDTVRRDRNHPSIVLWSAGNEIHDTPMPHIAKPILGRLLGVFHRFDPSRPVTQGLFRPNVSRDYENGLADMLDVVGQNYRENELVAAHRQNPARKVIGTENGHGREPWLFLRDHAFMAGQFLWPGIDYLGEADWPLTTFARGLLDRAGFTQPRGFERQSWWSDAPMVHVVRRVEPPPAPETDPGYAPAAPPRPRPPAELLSDWTPPVLTPHDEVVEVYSNAEEVALFLNGRALGVQTRSADHAPRRWTVPFAPGVLRAVARSRGREVARQELATAGPAARVVLKAEEDRVSPAWDDLAHVTAQIVDARGVRVPGAAHEITFVVSGPGTVAAVDNGDPASHEDYRAGRRRAFQGRCLALVRATASEGRITVSASAPGLAGGSTSFDAAPVAAASPR